MTTELLKPLGIKSYGSIGHLPGSQFGKDDKGLPEGQANILTVKVRDRHERVIVQEKLDGSCTAVAKVNGEILALGRAGWLAETSPYEQHKLFASWVKGRVVLFQSLLREGERLVGEWLAQAHGTRYKLLHEPWVCFDLMLGHHRAILQQLDDRIGNTFPRPYIIHAGGAYPISSALEAIQVSHHGAKDPVEGAVWRLERKGEILFLGKFVRPDKEIGKYLPEISLKEAIWNWRPE